MTKQKLADIQNQIHLHHNLKKWFSLSFILTSLPVAALLFLPVFWMKVVAGILLVLFTLVMLVIGLALWRSRKSLLAQLAEHSISNEMRSSF